MIDLWCQRVFVIEYISDLHWENKRQEKEGNIWGNMERNTGRTGLTEVEKDMFFCLKKRLCHLSFVLSLLTTVRKRRYSKATISKHPKNSCLNRGKLIFPELLTLYTQCVYFSWPSTFFSTKSDSLHLARFFKKSMRLFVGCVFDMFTQCTVHSSKLKSQHCFSWQEFSLANCLGKFW